jgi:hypothetical protein
MNGKKSDSTVLWWIGWITLTIAAFFAASAIWTPVIARHYGTMDRPGAPILWVTAVFGSWMVLLVPLIVVMYNKVDKAYEDARIARESAAHQKARAAFRVRAVKLDDADRRLDRRLIEKLKTVPPAVKRGHLVTAVLKDGRRVDHVFVLDRRDLMGVYGAERATFTAADVVDVVPADLDRLPAFQPDRWLRLDGIGTEAPA